MLNRPLFFGIKFLAMISFILQACAPLPGVPFRFQAIQASQTPPPSTPAASQLNLSDFQLVNQTQGWLLLNGKLFWTDNYGSSWKDITPTQIDGWSIAAAHFMDLNHGWLILVYGDADGTQHLALSRTQDGGNSWDFTSMPVFSPGDPASIVGKVSIFTLDLKTGWIVIKRQSSPAFNLGSLIKTSDGGDTWETMSLPGGDPVYFTDPSRGWIVTGIDHNVLYLTEDGGRTWQIQNVVDQAKEPARYEMPSFNVAGQGILPVLTFGPAKTRLAIYQSDDNGQSWRLASDTSVPSSAAQGSSYSVSPDGQWIMTLSDGEVLQGSYRGTELMGKSSWLQSTPQAGQKSLLPNHAQAVEGITSLDMASNTQGWAVSQSGSCTSTVQAGSHSKTGLQCTSSTTLVGTSDGGLTWNTITPPVAQSTAQAKNAAVASPSAVVIGQGFDTCEAPTVAQMATWFTKSPYSVFNVYMGGAWLGCLQSKMSLITKDYLGNLSQQGWLFIPTWVGPQAPCYCPQCTSKPQMSTDTGTAYNQGVNEANSAIQAAYNLGLTANGKTGTVIYYDMEAFNYTNTTCLNAVRSFLSGWTYQLHQTGNSSGVYSTSSALSNMKLTGLSNPPDNVWLAYWNYSSYSQSASVYNIYNFSNSIYTNDQRIHQYAGEHSETWGGTAIAGLDNNAIDGAVSKWINNGSDCPQWGGVIAYWGTNYTCANTMGDTGYRLLTASASYMNLNNGSFDNKTSSVYVPPCYTVNLYSDTYMNGYYVTISSSVPDLTTLGVYPNSTLPVVGSVSSMMAILNPECVYVYFPLVPNGSP